jgi:AraC family transcriptional regulator, ethanolamine operon transcriptional activator
LFLRTSLSIVRQFDIELSHAGSRREDIRMLASTQNAQENTLHVSSNDADELTTRIPNWDVELTQLQPGPFNGQLTFISLGPLLICHGKFDQPLLQHVAGPRGCLIVNRPGRGSAPLRHLGHEVEDDECFVGGPASEGEAVGLGKQFPTALSVRLDAWESGAEWLSNFALLSTRGTTLRRTGLPWANAFLDGMAWIADAVERYPERMARADVRESMADLLLTRVDALGAVESPVRQDRHARLHRRIAVARARDYIHRNLTEPIRLSALCRHARSEARALEYGFLDVVGLTPMQYVRTTRLHRARRLLRSIDVSRRTISEIALDSGFWHLSQFAVDYKALFGESPSMTFRRAQAELPARAGRARRAEYAAMK